MKKKYVKPAVSMLKVKGEIALMSGSAPHLNGSIQYEQPNTDFGIDISWGGSSKNDVASKDDQNRL